MFPIPTGIRAWIEDVVVDGAARGQGIGEALTVEALRLAEAAGARTVDLTSRASREAAGRLYERVGFKSRETRFYRYAFADVAASPASYVAGWLGGPAQPVRSASAASSRSTSDRSL